jgi:hypothetical protein
VIPAKHRLNSQRVLSLICLIDVVGIDPEVPQAVAFCLISIESDLLVPRFVFASVPFNILKAHLLRFLSLSVRKYRVRRWLVVVEASDNKLSIFTILQKTHRAAWMCSRRLR